MRNEDLEQPSTTETSKLHVGSLTFTDLGNTVRVSDSSRETLIEGGSRLAVILNHTATGQVDMELAKAKAALEAGEELRLGGCFAVYLMRSRGVEQLVVDNRNARGAYAYIKELGSVIQDVFET